MLEKSTSKNSHAVEGPATATCLADRQQGAPPGAWSATPFGIPIRITESSVPQRWDNVRVLVAAGADLSLKDGEGQDDFAFLEEIWTSQCPRGYASIDDVGDPNLMRSVAIYHGGAAYLSGLERDADRTRQIQGSSTLGRVAEKVLKVPGRAREPGSTRLLEVKRELNGP